MWYEKRSHLGYMLQGLGIKGPYIECGVGEGNHMTEIKNQWMGHCIGVDPYVDQSHAIAPDMEYGGDKDWEKSYRSVIRSHEIIRQESIPTAAEFEDGSVGCVYLDSIHTYTHVYDEMTAWWPKIEDGGIMVCHDYNFRGSRNGSWYGVWKAARDFATENNLALLTTSDKSDCYFLKIPYHKPEDVLLVSNVYGYWPEEVLENQQKYCDIMGYTYSVQSEREPKGWDKVWSKVAGLQKAVKEHPDKKYIFWIDADIVIHNPYPMHMYSFDSFDFVGMAYYVRGYGPPISDACICACWYGMPSRMKWVIENLFSYSEFKNRYPHDEGALTKTLNPRASDRALLDHTHNLTPTPSGDGYHDDDWMFHIYHDAGETRWAILKDLCRISKVGRM